jgi:hypothetical protein
MVTAPNGSIATFDRDATTALYRDIEIDHECICGECRNFRQAIAHTSHTALIRACETIGIDPLKAHELSALRNDLLDDTLLYSGAYPFIGSIIAHFVDMGEASCWAFYPTMFGTARIPDVANLIGINFLLEVPWVLPESRIADGPPKQ